MQKSSKERNKLPTTIIFGRRPHYLLLSPRLFFDTYAIRRRRTISPPPSAPRPLSHRAAGNSLTNSRSLSIYLSVYPSPSLFLSLVSYQQSWRISGIKFGNKICSRWLRGLGLCQKRLLIFLSAIFPCPSFALSRSPSVRGKKESESFSISEEPIKICSRLRARLVFRTSSHLPLPPPSPAPAPRPPTPQTAQRPITYVHKWPRRIASPLQARANARPSVPRQRGSRFLEKCPPPPPPPPPPPTPPHAPVSSHQLLVPGEGIGDREDDLESLRVRMLTHEGEKLLLQITKDSTILTSRERDNLIRRDFSADLNYYISYCK
jgi:hypothetical protein